MSLSELDPEVSRNLGGVGIIDFDNKNIRKTNPIHPGLQEVCGQGRVDLFCIQPIKNHFILMYCIYGYTSFESVVRFIVS